MLPQGDSRVRRCKQPPEMLAPGRRGLGAFGALKPYPWGLAFLRTKGCLVGTARTGPASQPARLLLAVGKSSVTPPTRVWPWLSAVATSLPSGLGPARRAHRPLSRPRESAGRGRGRRQLSELRRTDSLLDFRSTAACTTARYMAYPRSSCLPQADEAHTNHYAAFPGLLPPVSVGGLVSLPSRMRTHAATIISPKAVRAAPVDFPRLLILPPRRCTHARSTPRRRLPDDSGQDAQDILLHPLGGSTQARKAQDLRELREFYMPFVSLLTRQR